VAVVVLLAAKAITIQRRDRRRRAFSIHRSHLITIIMLISIEGFSFTLSFNSLMHDVVVAAVVVNTCQMLQNISSQAIQQSRSQQNDNSG